MFFSIARFDLIWVDGKLTGVELLNEYQRLYYLINTVFDNPIDATFWLKNPSESFFFNTGSNTEVLLSQKYCDDVVEYMASRTMGLIRWWFDQDEGTIFQSSLSASIGYGELHQKENSLGTPSFCGKELTQMRSLDGLHSGSLLATDSAVAELHSFIKDYSCKYKSPTVTHNSFTIIRR